MSSKRPAGPNFESFTARLIIAGALNELRADAEGFARLLLALSRVGDVEAAEVAQLLSATGPSVETDPLIEVDR